jgi:hypothetical protein
VVPRDHLLPRGVPRQVLGVKSQDMVQHGVIRAPDLSTPHEQRRASSPVALLRRSPAVGADDPPINVGGVNDCPPLGEAAYTASMAELTAASEKEGPR